MKFKVKTYRSYKDFKFGCFKLEMRSDGGHTIYGILKHGKNRTKYQMVYRYE